MLNKHFFTAITLILLSINSIKANELSLNIAKKMNLGNVEYLYTVEAVKSNENKGIKFENAIRLVPFQLISSLSKSAKQINNFQSFVINKIVTRSGNEKGHFELLGIIINNELYYLNDKKPEVTALITALSKNSIGVSGNKVYVK